MNRARRSFPDPLSPVMSTVESTCATRRARSSVHTIAGLELARPEGVELDHMRDFRVDEGTSEENQ